MRNEREIKQQYSTHPPTFMSFLSDAFFSKTRLLSPFLQIYRVCIQNVKKRTSLHTYGFVASDENRSFFNMFLYYQSHPHSESQHGDTTHVYFNSM